MTDEDDDDFGDLPLPDDDEAPPPTSRVRDTGADNFFFLSRLVCVEKPLTQ